MDAPTFDDLFRIARDAALANSKSLTMEVANRDGSDLNNLLAGSAAVGDDCVGQLVRTNAKLFFTTTRGKDMDLLAADRYQGQLPRKSAAPARVPATFTLPTAALASFTISDKTNLSTADGKVFQTQGQQTFPSGETSITFLAQSVLAGLDQQIGTTASGSGLTSITGNIPNAPAGLTVSNLVASAGADDDEQDEDYQRRCQTFYTVSRRGILAAIEQGALAVPGVRTATAYEDDRYVELVVADAFTPQLINATTIPPSYMTQTSFLDAQIQTELQNWRCAGIQVHTTMAIVSLVGAILLLRFKSDVDTVTAANAAKTQFRTYVNGLRPGQPFIYVDAINKLKMVPGLNVMGNEIVAPAGDVTPQALEVLRTDYSLIVASGGL